MKRLFSFISALLFVAGLFAGRTCQAQAVLRPGDTVEVRLGGVPAEEIGAFSILQAIDDGGMLNLSHIGKIKVAGLDVSEAQRLIEGKLRSDKIYTSPVITINVQTNTRLISVTGEVKASGRLSYTADLTVMTAIAGAGGFNDFADKKHVKLIRAGKMQMLDTTKFTSNPELDLKVLPGDQIFVPQSSGLPW